MFANPCGDPSCLRHCAKYHPNTPPEMFVLRRILNPMGTMDAIDFLLDKLRNTKNNSEFFDSMNA